MCNGASSYFGCLCVFLVGVNTIVLLPPTSLWGSQNPSIQTKTRTTIIRRQRTDPLTGNYHIAFVQTICYVYRVVEAVGEGGGVLFVLSSPDGIAIDILQNEPVTFLWLPDCNYGTHIFALVLV